jgi:DNA-directed RNA polymerase subunit RPC12/RpoP
MRRCSKILGKVETEDKVFENCPVCGNQQFYTSKDFNQAMGCLVMLCGIVLVPFTFGLSLPFFALIDWALYRRVPTMVVCYRCGSEFRNFKIPERLKDFKHPIGMKYDRFRK